jgi:NET1-associated nuclear protein 1 (U3 small nucleolar RNA-associated protein 17)
VAQADNTLRIINTSTMKVECSVYGVQPPPPGGLPGAPALQPGSASLVLPAANAVLQFYDVARDQHVAKLQVGGSVG